MSLTSRVGTRVRRVELALVRPRVQLGVLVAVVLWLAVVATQLVPRGEDTVQRARLLTCLLPLGAGLLLARLRPHVRTGPQLALVGIFFAATTAGRTEWRSVWWLIDTYNTAFTLVFYVILAHPYGRLVDSASRVTVRLLLSVALAFDVGFMLFVDPSKSVCPTCPPDINILLVEHQPVPAHGDGDDRVAVVLP